MSDIDAISISVGIPSDIIRKMKVRCDLSISYEQFLSLEAHASKTGGKFVRQLVDALKPQFDKVKQALELIK